MVEAVGGQRAESSSEGREGAEWTWPRVLGPISRHEDVSGEATRWAMGRVMSGEATGAQIAALGLGLSMKGPTPVELAGLRDAMLDAAVRVPGCTRTVDVVGTGGDGAHTVNISTMASVAVAACGIPVLKHGNRAASSTSGGADVLEAIGVRLARSPEEVAADVENVGIGFCFAPQFHPALRHAAAPRRDIGVPTVFNVLGPLSNPAQPSSGLIGCAFPGLLDVIAQVFADQGDSVLVVRGNDGLDELTISGPSRVLVVGEGSVREEQLSPEDVGLSIAPLESLRGGTGADNAEVARRVWGGERGPVRDAVVLNAAGALVAFEGSAVSGDLREAMFAAARRVESVLDDGSAAEVLSRWVERTQRSA